MGLFRGEQPALFQLKARTLEAKTRFHGVIPGILRGSLYVVETRPRHFGISPQAAWPVIEELGLWPAEDDSEAAEKRRAAPRPRSVGVWFDFWGCFPLVAPSHPVP